MMRKVVSSLLVVAMVCAGFTIVGGFKAKANFIETINVPWTGTFVPKDVAWDHLGRYCVVVGNNISSPNQAYIYYSVNKTWAILTGYSAGQQFSGVCWDRGVYSRFWLASNAGPGLTTYYLDVSNTTTITSPPGSTTSAYDAVACDHVGNPLYVGFKLSTGAARYYNMTSGSWTPLLVANSTTNIDFRGVTYNMNDYRFYAVGNDTSTGGVGTSWYSDVAPLNSGSHFNRDTTPMFVADFELFSIDWNQVYNFGLAVGRNGTYKVDGYWSGTSLNWTIIERGNGNTYKDVCWDTNGYDEAAIVGQNKTGLDTYWRYYISTGKISHSVTGAGASFWNCVAVKPPASPKWVIIPASGGGIIFNILEKDQGTNVVLNAAFPHIFSIDFREATTGISRLNQQVDVDATYTFVVEANYTIGGVNSWNSADINITAWLDEGMTGTNSNPNTNWGAVENRTRQFSLWIDGQLSTPTMTYPVNPPVTNEFVIASSNIYGPFGLDFRYYTYVNVTLRAQTRAADGSGFPGGPATSGIWDKNSGLNDVNSWDFCVSVYDQVNTGAANYSYEEFGVKKAVSISASGNPTGNAPPGSNNVVLTPTSAISYAANCPYCVNASIPNLYLNGVIGPNLVPAINMRIHNANVNSSAANSDVDSSSWPTGRAFPGADMDLIVWGKNIPTYLSAPGNGTVAVGPWESNYNNMVNPYTVVSWWANVPAGIPEGTYWAVITYTIYNP